ncbi:phosphatidylinositol transfer protein csr1 [Spiromyces aspiralis]|uniref:Phosphatidylinositol transfer protein csr1 n=1 Tax=Spiromyces aspiralis TaxID=68401 RepID=A0ACC1HUG4_9FUNG|nr:phosphatidylinositol transfer protein csr1 [Spiromyces aspiralis]
MPVKITDQFACGKLDRSGCINNLSPDEKSALKQFWKFYLDNKDLHWEKVESDPVSIINTSSDKEENKPDPNIEVYDGCTFGQTIQERMMAKGLLKEGEDIVPVPFKSLRQDDSYGEAFWSAIRQDSPDVLLLRFLRARKWDVRKANLMGAAAVKWRAYENVEEILWTGESMNEASLMAKGVSFIHGHDKLGHPIIWSPSCKHHQRDQPFASMKRYLIWMMETARQLLQQPIEKVCLIMDLTDHSNANMDWPFVKMFLKILEAYYPECLAICIVYNGPWWFSGVYKMITPLLDPVVAAKIQFAKNGDGLRQFIDNDQLLASRGGSNKYEYQYVFPKPGENDLMKDQATRDALVEKRREIIKRLEEATRQWVYADSDNNERMEEEREQYIKDYIEVSRKLEDYARARHLYHRLGVVTKDGLDWDAAK